MSIRQLLHALVWAQGHRIGRMMAGEFDGIGPFIRSHDVVFDVGAHGGSWTAPLSEAVPDGFVYAFEALPYYARVLRTTARLCRWRNVAVINKAVTEHGQPVSMVWRDDAGHRLGGMTHVAGVGEIAGKRITVRGVTLDGFHDRIGRRPVRFIKIDIEGCELLALRGAVRLIDSHRPLLWCEVWSQWTQRYGYTPRDVFDFFTERDYRAFLLEPQRGFVPIDAEQYTELDRRSGPLDCHDILAAPSEVDVQHPNAR